MTILAKVAASLLCLTAAAYFSWNIFYAGWEHFVFHSSGGFGERLSSYLAANGQTVALYAAGAAIALALMVCVLRFWKTARAESAAATGFRP